MTWWLWPREFLFVCLFLLPSLLTIEKLSLMYSLICADSNTAPQDVVLCTFHIAMMPFWVPNSIVLSV
jgi:hypothetical protein